MSEFHKGMQKLRLHVYTIKTSKVKVLNINPKPLFRFVSHKILFLECLVLTQGLSKYYAVVKVLWRVKLTFWVFNDHTWRPVLMHPDRLKQENIFPYSLRSTRSKESMGHFSKCPNFVELFVLLFREPMVTIPREIESVSSIKWGNFFPFFQVKLRSRKAFEPSSPRWDTSKMKDREVRGSSQDQVTPEG